MTLPRATLIEADVQNKQVGGQPPWGWSGCSENAVFWGPAFNGNTEKRKDVWG